MKKDYHKIKFYLLSKLAEIWRQLMVKKEDSYFPLNRENKNKRQSRYSYFIIILDKMVHNLKIQKTLECFAANYVC